MNNSVEFKKLYAKAIRCLSRRDHSIQEIRQKLKGASLKGGTSLPRGCANALPGGVSNDIIDAVIDKLVSQKFLDDSKFAQSFVRFKLSQKPLGERSLLFQLKKKGIDTALAQASLRHFFSSPNVALQLAKAALSRKKFSTSNSQSQFVKQMRFLISRGFSYETAKKAIDDLAQKE